jgi:aminoglycoside/choline kinase family phosphotransferase
MSDRCANILRDFTDTMMRALTYDLVSLVSEDTKTNISSFIAKTDVQMNTLTDLRKVEDEKD